ncbi:MAG TPA: hypothetical protein VFB32_11490 [Rudaea sp.]|nr:hypothetical protein [Rudaea sp.]
MMEFIDVGLGLALVYALSGLVCTTLHEGVAQLLSLRWRNLNRALNELLGAAKYLDVQDHPLIKSVWAGSRKPTGIPVPILARALVGGTALSDGKELFGALPPHLQQQIGAFLAPEIKAAQDVYDAAEKWFDASLKSATDWYARNANVISLVIAVSFAFALNIDTIGIANRLWHEPTERAALVDLAQKTAATHQAVSVAAPAAAASGTTADPAANLGNSAVQLRQELDELDNAAGVLIGWDSQFEEEVKREGLTTKLLGLLASGIAISLGAKFWFGVISKVVTVRAGLKQSDTAPAQDG